MITPGIVLMKREKLVTLGGFDQSVVPADDYDIYSRIARHGVFGFIPKVVLNYRIHATNASNTYNIRDATFMVRRKMAASPENDAKQADLAKRAFGA